MQDEQFELSLSVVESPMHRRASSKLVRIGGVMKAHSSFKLWVFTIWIGMVPFLVSGIATTAQGQNSSEEGMEVLTRGPIHEAFANVSSNLEHPDLVVPKIAPDPIEELPPDQRPEGEDVAWIPGYWSWDDERTDFIWVSGVWRNIPPGRQWVPGYWTVIGNGGQYIPGFWEDIDQQETVYLPPPPASQESGPSSPQPSMTQVWTPGTWVWHENRYAWQPGYWVQGSPDWVWMPARYQWTPRGYIFVQGYWDYDLDRRGVMFAPVYYSSPVYARPHYYYTPVIALDIRLIALSLFTLSNSHHYHFGDYYDARYEHRGYHPWYSKHATAHGYDPFFIGYRSHQIGRDPEWERRLHEQYRYRREHADARPPQTFALQMNFINTHPGASRNEMIGRRFSDVVENKSQPVRFRPLDDNQRKNIQIRGRDVHKIQLERKKMEIAPIIGERIQKPADIKQPVKIQLPKSPISANHRDQNRIRPQQPPQDRTRDRQEPPQSRPQDRQEPPQARPQDQRRVVPQEQPVVKPQEIPQDRTRDRQEPPQARP